MVKPTVTPRSSRRPRRRTTWIVLGSAAMLLALGTAYLAHERWLARHLTARLDAMDDEQAVTLLRESSHLSSGRGIELLVHALASRRPPVVEAARRELLGLVERWEVMPSRDAASRRTALAKGLAARITELDARGRDTAAQVAMRLLVLPAEALGPDRAEMLGACEQILRGYPDRSAFAGRAGVDSQDGQANAIGNRPLVPATPGIDQLAPLPGGGLPALPAELPRSSAALDSLGEPRDDDPQRPPRGDDSDGDEPRLAPAIRQVTTIEESFNTDAPSILAGDELRRSHDPTRASDSSFGHGDSSASPSTAEGLDSGELMRLLHSSDPRTVEAAQAELVRRGFTPRHLELAARLTDPDALIRQEWARKLPTMTGIDARAWLMWLAQDESPDVRITALTLLATTGDLTTVQEATRMASEDADPRVRRHAEQLLSARPQDAAARRPGSLRRR